MSEKTDVIILAGGLGTRLRSAVPDLPKVLSPVNGRPFLDYVLHALHRSRVVNSVILTIGYLGGQIVEEYSGREGYNFDIRFSIEETLLGTGGAVKKALRQADTDDVVVLNGDSYIDVNLKDVVEFHRQKRASMTIVIKKMEDASRYGLVEFDGDQRISSFREKMAETGAGYINAGLYVFGKELFDDVEEDRAISFEKELMPSFINGGGVFAFPAGGRFIDIGTPETYRMAEEFFGQEFGI